MIIGVRRCGKKKIYLHMYSDRIRGDEMVLSLEVSSATSLGINKGVAF